jgi:hypothetical protein
MTQWFLARRDGSMTIACRVHPLPAVRMPIAHRLHADRAGRAPIACRPRADCTPIEGLDATACLRARLG